MSVKAYNTNLASEFYVLSALHRLGADAVLTLGNKKSVDIAVVRGPGDSLTIDVKGLAGTTGWPVDNVGAAKAHHYIVFVCYAGQILDLQRLPDVWVVPSSDLEGLVYHAPGGRRLVRRDRLLKAGQQYRNAWALIVGGQ